MSNGMKWKNTTFILLSVDVINIYGIMTPTNLRAHLLKIETLQQTTNYSRTVMGPPPTWALGSQVHLSP